MFLSDTKVEEFYSIIYAMDTVEHSSKYAIQCLLQLEAIEKELESISIIDPISQFRLDNLLSILLDRKNYFKFVLKYKQEELDLYMATVVSFIIILIGFYQFSGLFN